MSAERYVRVCPKHRRLLLEDLGRDQLRCPEGNHVVAAHATLDRAKGLLLLPEGQEEKVRMSKTPPSPVQESKGKIATLEAKKFVDAKNVVLWVRLARRRQRFEVTWRRFEGKRSTGGTVAIEPSQERALARYHEAVREAEKLEWKPVPSNRNGRECEIKPIPAANAQSKRGAA